jgi:hypothetical protein
MKECWSEGKLRAYLDGEVTPEEKEQAGAHLAECAECRALSEVLSARAERVSLWMEALAQSAEPIELRPRGRRSWRWAAAALAAAAAIVVAVLMAPHRMSPPPPAVAATAPAPVYKTEPAPPAPLAQEAAHEAVHEAGVRPHKARRPEVHRPAEQTETFVALDNEPFEAGWVVRMALGPDQIPADVVFSADGRARAYRLIGSSSN